MAVPAVTVVIATRDRPALLRDALADVAAQRRRPLEVRIGDDGTIPVHAAVESLPALEVTLVGTGGAGPATARNAAAAGARGEVLAFLDDDDRWAHDHLERLLEAFRDEAVGFAFTDWVAARERLRADGAREVLERRTVALDWDLGRMRRDDHLPPSTWGVRRTLFERLGGFDPGFRFSEDWDFALRAAALTAPRRVPGASVEVRLRPAGNTSAEMGSERIACLERLARRHGLTVPGPKTFWEIAQEATGGAEAT